MAEIELRNVSKHFGKTRVIENLNLTIKDGEFTVLVGASGCGKTTLLRIIAGIGPATSGQVFMDGVEITHLAPRDRNLAMVFQNYAIYPTMNVRENIEFGLRNRRVPADQRNSLIQEYTKIVGMDPYLKRMPNELSGGQRQRIALARAMVKKPKVFLMDEPLSNLDAKLRAAMRVELSELQANLGATFVYVTHDQVEAMSMADTIVLMEQGEIQQVGSPEEIYHHPANIFTAQFMGTPPMNIYKDDKTGMSFGFRPEKVGITRKGALVAEALNFKGMIRNREMLGSETLYSLNVRGEEETVIVKSRDESMRQHEEAHLYVYHQDIHYFNREGQAITSDEADPSLIGGYFHA